MIKTLEKVQMISLVKLVMGTAFTTQVVVEGRQASALLSKVAQAQGALETWLAHVDAVFSPYKDDSELSRYRRGALDYLQLSDEMRFVLASCWQFKTATKGAFDAEGSGQLDTSGFVKGWAIEEGLRQYLQPLFEHSAVLGVNLIGGGDMQFQTREGADWKFGIAVADPFDKKKIIASFELATGAVATSGSAERGNHIYGADKAMVQTTVIGQSLQEVDVWATALMVAPNLSLPSHLQGLLVDREGRQEALGKLEWADSPSNRS